MTLQHSDQLELKKGEGTADKNAQDSGRFKFCISQKKIATRGRNFKNRLHLFGRCVISVRSAAAAAAGWTNED